MTVNKSQPLLTASLMFALCLIFVLVAGYLEQQRFVEEERSNLIGDLSQVRGDLEAVINADFNLTRGLIAAIVANPAITQQEFALMAKNLFRYNPGLRNIGLAPNNVISYIYPLAGNEEALGLDYAKNPQQWPAVKRAIESGETIVAGPVKLVQGGEAFICRSPVFLFPTDETLGGYWGMTSIVLEKKTLLEQAGFYRPNRNFKLALRGKDGLGEDGGPIAGDPAIFTDSPLSLQVRLPSGSWQLAAVPVGGWQRHSPLCFWILAGGSLLSALLSWVVFWWSSRQVRLRLEIEGAKRLAEDAAYSLARNETFLNGVLDNIPSLIFVKDARCLRYLRVNRSWERMVGPANEDVVGKQDSELFPEAQAVSFTQQDREVVSSREPLDIPLERLEAGGRLLCYIHTRKIPILDGAGNILYVLGFSEDITDMVTAQKAREELERQLEQARRLESIGLMAAGVAHDLNNILAGIVGYPELMLRKLPPESELRKPLQEIHRSGRRAATVVADLLTVARGAASIKKTADLHALVNDYLTSPEFTKLQALHPDVSYELHLEATSCHILCSAIHIKKSLMNLVTNASEAIDGKGRVAVRSSNVSFAEEEAKARKLSPGEYVLLQVEDNGPGIPADTLAHIFEPFFSRKVMGRSGTGLGLTVVWNTIADHQGVIEVASSRQGTVFQLFIPVCKDDQGAVVLSDKSEIPLGHGETLLVVDDEEQLRDLACQMLRSLNYQVYAVKSGEDGVEFVKHTPVDLVVLDMLMEPGMNGFKTYQALLEVRPGQKAIIASGYSQEDDVAAAMALGAGAFIQKPYLLEQLGTAVNQILSTPSSEEA